jgi:glycerophosphoryl diester phosphodiesterase
MSGALHLGTFDQPEKETTWLANIAGLSVKRMRKLIIAHRGASSMARENTLEAFQKAIDLRADMIEFDVRRTGDQRYVVHHDPHIAGKPLNEITCREVREFARSMGFHVPELEEALRLACGRIGLDIELKEEGYEREVLDRICDVLPEADYIVSSFRAGSISRVKQYRPGVRTGFIFQDAGALTSDIVEGDTDWLFPVQSLASDELLERMRRTGKKIAIWTVNDTQQMKRLLDDNRVEGIITDRADAALAVRDGRKAPD